MNIQNKIPASERIELTFIKDFMHIKAGQKVSYSSVNAMQMVANQRKLDPSKRFIDVNAFPKEALSIVKEKEEVALKSKK